MPSPARTPDGTADAKAGVEQLNQRKGKNCDILVCDQCELAVLARLNQGMLACNQCAGPMSLYLAETERGKIRWRPKDMLDDKE